MKEALVRGGAGFVGSHLVESFVNKNVKVTVLDNFSNGSDKNLQVKDKIKMEDFDISATDWTRFNYTKPDVIFHLVTHPRLFSIKDPFRNLTVNALGTPNVSEFAKRQKSKVIYTSNSGICGDPKFFSVTEEHPDNYTDKC